MQRILLKRGGGVGDVLMTTAVANKIKQLNPETYISFQTNFPALLYNNQDINQINPVGGHYDRIIDFNGAAESITAWHEGRVSEHDYLTFSRLALFFRQAQLELPQFFRLRYVTSQEEDNYASNIWQRFTDKKRKRVVYVLNSVSHYRIYPLGEAFQVLEALSRHVNIIIAGNHLVAKTHGFFLNYYEWYSTKADKNHVSDMVGSTNLRQIAAIINKTDLVISPDTGLLHMANALDIPCLGLFGNIPPNLRCDRYDNTMTLFSNPTCLCHSRGRTKDKYCPSKAAINRGMMGAACMSYIRPQSVIDLAAEMVGVSSTKLEYYISKYLKGNGLKLILGESIPNEGKYDHVFIEIDENSDLNKICALVNEFLIISGKRNNHMCSRHVKNLMSGRRFYLEKEWSVINRDSFLLVYSKKQRKSLL